MSKNWLSQAPWDDPARQLAQIKTQMDCVLAMLHLHWYPSDQQLKSDLKQSRVSLSNS